MSRASSADPLVGAVKTCADCGCDETRGCAENRHGRPFFCRLTELSITGLPPVLCSFCLDARGHLDLQGWTARESLVGLTFELKGRTALEEMAEELGRPPEVMRALAALDTPCRACAERPRPAQPARVGNTGLNELLQQMADQARRPR